MLPNVNIILEFFGVIRHFIEACVYKEPVAQYLPYPPRYQRTTIKFENLKNNFKERLQKSENLQLVTKSLRSL